MVGINADGTWPRVRSMMKLELSQLKILWSALKSQRTLLDDTSFISLLTTRVHASVANVPLRWDVD